MIQISIFNAIKIWYLLMYMNQVTLMPEFRYYHSVEKLYGEISDYYQRFTKGLAGMIYDYIIYTAAHETTHAPKNHWVTFETMYGQPIEIAKNYKSDFFRLNPIKFLDAAVDLFGEEWQNNIYGGEKWAIACEIALNRKSDILFIDSSVDLEHNTGSFFNKPNPFFNPMVSLGNFLDGRAKITGIYDLGYFLIDEGSICWDKKLRNIVRRFYFLCLNRISGPNFGNKLLEYCIDRDILYDWEKEKTINGVLNYEPIKYTCEFYRFNIIDSESLPSQQYAQQYDDEKYY